jgi:hypothetical protein
MSTTPNDKQDGDPAVRPSDWLAAFCRYHASDYSMHDSQEEAEAEMKAGEDDGECYGVATYHIPTKTLHMRDPLNASDPEKVRASIEAWLAANARGQARRAQGVQYAKRLESRRCLHHACSALPQWSKGQSRR